jgi:hypothetical protein
VWPPEKETIRYKSGTVTEVVHSSTDAVYRYRVILPDGNVETFFGFELELES